MFAAEPGQLKVLGESQIPIIDAGASDRILRHGPKHTGFVVRAQLRYGYLPEICRVKPARGWTELRIINRTLFYAKFAQRVAQYISSYSTRHTRDATCSCDGRALAECCYSIKLPSTHGGTDEAVVGVGKEGDGVNIIHAEGLALVQR